MTSKLICPVCPYCDKLLHCDGTQYINERIVEMWYCQNPECEETEDFIGTREMWEIVANKIQAKQNLERSEKCCSAWEIQALDYRNALKDIVFCKQFDSVIAVRKYADKALETIGKHNESIRSNIDD